jgi:hypothetical protein
MAVRYFALGMGIIFLALGILGFLPGLVTPPRPGDPELAVEAGHGYLFGLVPVNLLHNLVHIVFGLWGVVAYRNFVGSRFYARAVAVVFGVLTIMGLVPVLNTVFGLVPIHDGAVVLHALITVAAVYFGWMVPAAREEAPGIERRAA